MRRLVLALACAVALPNVGPASGQVYLSRPITIIVPYPPAGLIDALARIVAEFMRGSLAQSVVIENIGGAGGSIGVGRVARAAPDGYTLSIGASDQFVLNGALYPLQYDV
jgi:tripartite-type tricarboxylate transporter receptor subunit TctC